MPAELLDGRALAARIIDGLRGEVQRLARHRATPHLVSLLVRDDPGAALYVRRQKEKCRELGIKYTLFHMSDDLTEEELIDHLNAVNDNRGVTGIILQLPLPEGMNVHRVQAAIAPDKDVEGVTPRNLGHLVRGDGALLPCTALGVMEMLRGAGLALRGKDAVIVGHSEIVGKPLSLMLLAEGCTTTTCHVDTADLARHTRAADILISATGKGHLITGEMVKEGAVVIDVGVSKVTQLGGGAAAATAKEQLVAKPARGTIGDVDMDSVLPKARAVSPHKGGVGPLTVAMLLRNTVTAARRAAEAEGR